MSRAGNSTLYEFRVRGELSDVVVTAFPDLLPARRQGETTLTGEVPDQAALFGVLDRIQALGIQLIEVRRIIEPASPQPPKTSP